MSAPKFTRLLEPGIPARVPKARRRAVDGLSADAARTQRNRESLARGVHPITNRPVCDQPGVTCGNCAHHFVHVRGKRYHKCELNATGGAATDLRVSWPGCDQWVSDEWKSDE